MNRVASRPIGLAALVAALVPSPRCEGRAATDAVEEVFRPEGHFPGDALLYAAAPSLPRFGAELASTLPGRLLTHPEVRAAFPGLLPGLRERLESAWKPVVDATGRTPLEILGLLSGEVALAVRWNLAAGPPEAVLAVELGENREAILDLLARLRARCEEARGAPLATRVFEDVEAVVWPLPRPLYQARLGTHLVAASAPDLLRDVAARYRGASGTSLAESPFHRELAPELAGESHPVRLEVDLERLREILLRRLAPGGDQDPAGTRREEIHRALRAGGLDRLTALGLALGVRDGGLEVAVHLGWREGPGGFLEVLESAFPPVAGAAAGLELVPAAATGAGALRLVPGKLLRGLDRLLRREVPELSPRLDGLWKGLEERCSLRREDLFSLGEITLWSFSVRPPAGGLLADTLVLARTAELESYWQLLRRVASALEVPLREVHLASGRVEYVNLGEVLAKGRTDGARRRLSLPAPTEVLVLAFLGGAGGGVVARTDLEGGWSALSTLPQALVRCLEFYSRGPRLAERRELQALALERLEGARAACVFESGSFFLAAWNTALSGASFLAPLLAREGVDVARLPPAEAFQGHVRPGYLRLTAGPRGASVEAHRVLESPAAVALVGAAAAMLWPGRAEGK